MPLIAEFQADLVSFAISIALVAAYYLWLHIKVRGNPTYTIHGVNELARRLWVENIMRNSSKDIMAVQTLRNFIMGATLMGSTAALLIIGTLTLSGQADNIAHSWGTLNLGGSHASALWILKVMLLLVDFIFAFFSFSMAVRLANHVVFMINVPAQEAHYALSPKAVARRLHRAGNMFALGMRAFFFAIPLVFWLFGPYFLLVSTIGLVMALYHLDRSEREDGALEADSPLGGQDVASHPLAAEALK
ncbi:MAG: DUF599 domain-containing protein [Pseudomonadota bacterium]